MDDQTAFQTNAPLHETLELRRYAHCRAQGQPYFGSHMGALQGQPVRHAYMDKLVEQECGTRIQRPMQLLEIGSWAGGSAITWANALNRYNPRRGSVVCVDPWKTYFEASGISQLTGVKATHYSEMQRALASDEIFALFQHNIRSAKVEDAVVTVRGSSEQVLPLLAARRFDLIFVDGNHSYASVLSDLRLAAELVAEGGILCGDDLELQAAEIDLSRAQQMAHVDYALDLSTQKYYHPGVTLAVGEFFGSTVSCHEGFWYMRKTLGGWQPIELAALPAEGVSLPQHFRVSDDFVLAPRLVKEGCNGYNIVQYGERFFALHLSLGHVDLGLLNDEALGQLQQTGKCVVGQSLQQVADSLGGPVSGNSHLKLNGSNHPLKVNGDLRNGRHPSLSSQPAAVAPGVQLSSSTGKPSPNDLILEHDGIYYAVPQHLGSIDLTHPAERNLPQILTARTRVALDSATEQAAKAACSTSSSPVPRVMERDYHGFQLSALDGLFLATESNRGGPDLAQLRAGQFGTLFASETLSELKCEVDAFRNGGHKRAQRALVIAADSPEGTRELIRRTGCQNPTVLVQEPRQALDELPCIAVPTNSPDLVAKLRSVRPELVVVPYGERLGEVPWERFVSPFCRELLAIFPDGGSRLYRGDHFSRILYNMAYLRSMYRQVPSLAGQRVLEVGCSDGLTCDLVAHEGPASVTGVDMLQTVGLRHNNPRCTFHHLDATTLPFADSSFDLVYSIATFEHVSDPLATLKTIKRMLRPGGYGYIQAAPLYYSPFGHHMFGYFDHYPWIHVRLSKTEIGEYARANGIAAQIEAARGGRAEDYIESMINLHHINGKLLHEYKLEEFASLPGIEIVNYTPSFEGENLVTPEILAQTKPVQREDLVAHGFELVFRVK